MTGDLRALRRLMRMLGPQWQFTRPPYAVGFQIFRSTFNFVTLHALCGSTAAERVPELRAMAQWMADWARQGNRWRHNLLVRADFTIDRHDDSLWQAFTSADLTAPAALNDVVRSIVADPAGTRRDKSHDQIACCRSGVQARVDLQLGSTGHVDFVPHLHRDVERQRVARLSDPADGGRAGSAAGTRRRRPAAARPWA
jgi:hypothetical protein